jgi:hypothetical protein
MTKTTKPIDVYLEIGQTKTFAVALDWPGLGRSGRDEASALQALCDYGPRYAQVLQGTRLGFHAPAEVSALKIVERVKGTATTNFGAPDVTLDRDKEPVAETDLKRWQTILKACWRALDKAVEDAEGHQLSKGPRGGGRALTKIIEHVRDVDVAYLSSLGGKVKVSDISDPHQALEIIRKEILSTLEAAVRGEIPAHGPRGGLRWTPRYFVRRLAWHELDHVWEIEDRSSDE